VVGVNAGYGDDGRMNPLRDGRIIVILDRLTRIRCAYRWWALGRVLMVCRLVVAAAAGQYAQRERARKAHVSVRAMHLFFLLVTNIEGTPPLVACCSVGGAISMPPLSERFFTDCNAVFPFILALFSALV
jgi:hypothetical protein